MSALAINNLTAAADLNSIAGGAPAGVLVGSYYQGSHIAGASAWQYRYTTYTFKGFAFSSQFGLVRKYDRKRVYSRTQYQHKHWNDYYK